MSLEEDFDRTIAQIETSIRSARERLSQQAEGVASAVALLHDRPLAHESRMIVLSMEVFAGECANMAAWMLHIRGEHEHARELVHAAHVVQKAVKEALEKE